jgi:hypothetical protein
MKPRTASFVLWVATLLWFLSFACAWSLVAGQAFEQVGRVVEAKNYDPRGIRVWQLQFQGGTVTVMADDDTALAKVLDRAERVRVSVQPVQLEVLER